MRLATCSLAVLFVAAIAISVDSGVAAAQDNPQPQAQGGSGNAGGGGGARRGFDPAQMSQMMKERLGATDDEWKVIEPRLQKVMELRRGRMGALFGGRRAAAGAPGQGAAPGGDAQAQGGQNAPAPGGQGGPGRVRGFGGPQTPEAQALQKVLDDKGSSPDQIKSALKAYRESVEKQEKEVQKARQDLREVLSLRQEAQLVLIGMLD
ncbi:MAG: hypothetical protein HZB26_00950 [Candidatus Hydrogenedentes bacterium]|nr:hypothetical protein [Candidatus Hydrogenedentota bacterium]